MRLKPNEINRICRRVITVLTEKKLFIPKCDAGKLTQRLVELVQKNMEEEVAIDQEAQKMMAQYDDQIRSGQADYHRVYQMIKNKIAKDRKFVL